MKLAAFVGNCEGSNVNQIYNHSKFKTKNRDFIQPQTAFKDIRVPSFKDRRSAKIYLMIYDDDYIYDM
jgi:hypothetical protein